MDAGNVKALAARVWDIIGGAGLVAVTLGEREEVEGAG